VWTLDEQQLLEVVPNNYVTAEHFNHLPIWVFKVLA